MIWSLISGELSFCPSVPSWLILSYFHSVSWRFFMKFRGITSHMFLFFTRTCEGLKQPGNILNVKMFWVTARLMWRHLVIFFNLIKVIILHPAEMTCCPVQHTSPIILSTTSPLKRPERQSICSVRTWINVSGCLWWRLFTSALQSGLRPDIYSEQASLGSVWIVSWCDPGFRGAHTIRPVLVQRGHTRGGGGERADRCLSLADLALNTAITVFGFTNRHNVLESVATAWTTVSEADCGNETGRPAVCYCVSRITHKHEEE